MHLVAGARPVGEEDVDHWDQTMAVNLRGQMLGCKHAVRAMLRTGGGSIVNTSSAAGLLPTPLNAPYCTAKHAVVGLSLSLRLEAADLGVKVSAVCPGYVRTPIFDTAVTVNLLGHSEVAALSSQPAEHATPGKAQASARLPAATPP